MPRGSSNALGRDHIRSVNQRAVIDAIHRHGRISRSDLATLLNLSPSAITAITAPFVAEGLVVEGELGTTTSVGRKPILLEIDYDHAHVFGVKVTAHAVITALTNLGAEPVATRTDPLPDLTTQSVTATVAHAMAALHADAKDVVRRVIGVGVNVPGIVEHQSGTVRHSPLLGWYDVPFAAALFERIGLPVLVENDVNALAAAQAWFGHGREHHAFLVVTLGRGVGLGIVIEGAVYRGPTGGAGELGHTVVTPVRPAIMPQEPTTLEALLCDEALLEQARRASPHLGRDARSDDLTRLAAAGDPGVLLVLADAGAVLGVALANLVNIFAPSRIVLGGEGMRNAPYLLPPLRRALAEHAFGDLGDHVDVVVDAWGDDAWARGAAGLAAARFLQEAAIPLTAASVHPGAADDPGQRVEGGPLATVARPSRS